LGVSTNTYSLMYKIHKIILKSISRKEVENDQI